MKHYTDLTEAEKNEFADKLGEDLTKFFEQARIKYNMCDRCLHNAVVVMCENYMADQEAMISNAKH